MSDLAAQALPGQGFSLEGRVALVTGSTSGIGLAIAAALAQAGARVAINGRDPDRVRAVSEALPRAMEAPFDITNFAAAEAAIDRIGAQAGRFDILVCSAAARDRRSVEEIEPEAFREVLESNTVSAFQLTRLAASKMSNGEHGRVIFVSSTGARRPFRGDPVYAASKAALESLARSLAFEFGARGITANVIAPGFVLTEFNKSWTEDEAIRGFIETRVPTRRWASPEEIAGVAVFLASDAASYVNGHVLTVDAGMSVIL